MDNQNDIMTGEEVIELTVPEEHHLERIDRFLAGSLEIDLSRSFIQKLIKSSNIKVNDKDIKQNYRVKTDDNIIVIIPEPEEFRFEPQDIPVDIVYQDESVAVVNKPPGMVVHPGPGNREGTLANALLFHLKNLSAIGGVIRPGIVHRLDKDTSGLMVVARNDRAHRFLADEFAKRSVLKRYNAVVLEKPESDHGIIERPIGRHPKYRQKMAVVLNGRDAVTEYTLKKVWNTNRGVFSFLELTLHTGRTHQIRVHLASMGTPVVGDPVYSKKWAKHKVPFLLLASTYLRFTHPDTGEPAEFSIPLPEHIDSFIKKLDSRMGFE